jgi:ATP diphosphatase
MTDLPADGLPRLVAIMARLRDPQAGCEWDVAQDFETIAPYTIEEAYEVADAIGRGDMDALKDELGDLQLQIVYHARMAEEIGAFALDDVMASISAKMIRRHPHIFGDATASPGWEALKAAERAGHADDSAIAGVALALPALKRAEKIQRRAARIGFDWPDAEGPRAKIDEELGEIERAEDDEERAAEIGDLLFAVVNYARHLEVNAETALREATKRFETRFRKVEELAEKPLKDMDIDALEALWQRAKKLV